MAFLLFFRWLFGGRQASRQIFRFWDGQRDRAADPLVIYRAIETDPQFNVEVDSALLEAGDSEATVRAVGAVQRAFGVKDFDHGGLLESEALALLVEFYEFLALLKKSTSDTPTSSAPTESAFSDPALSNTSSLSGSGKTPSE